MISFATANLLLTSPQAEDLPVLIDFHKRNKEHLSHWETFSIPTQEMLNNWIKECDEGKSFRLFLRVKDDPENIIGMCNFTQIFRGPFQACYLGYKIDGQYQGKKLMQEALEAAIRHVFDVLKLHRIMANYIPGNTRSAHLLKKLGFVIEGHAKNYLLINGKWEDHVLTALTNEKWDK